MKKLYITCILIIVIGTIINVYLYMNKPNTVNRQNVIDPRIDVNYNSGGLARPIAFMINNIPEALPQSGISGADYIYEMLVEGGLTRLMAIYTKGNAEKIGPIRSARHNFLDISMEYDAIYAHFGGSPRSFQDISALSIPSLNGIILDGKMYWRDKNRKAPHNAYTNISKTTEYAKKYSYDKSVPVNHFKYFAADTDISGTIAEQIKIPYSATHISSYQYDKTAKLYKRYMGGKPHIDDLKKSQLAATNIIIQFAKNNSIDDEDRQEIYLVGTGKGYFITNGKYIDINWSKSARNAKTIFTDKTGKEIILNKGQTWIQIVPIDAKIEIK